jgi:hypothetical protein
VDERDREVGGVLEAQRPIERRIASADDDAGLAPEDILAPHEVVQPAALPHIDVLNLELARLERTVAGGDDQRAREKALAGLSRERQELLAVLRDALEVGDLLAEMDVRAELKALFDAQVDEFLPQDLRMPGDIVDVLLGIDGRDLPAELAEALDDANARIAVARVVRGCETDRPRADDRDVEDARAHPRNDATPRETERDPAVLVTAARAAAAGVRGDRLGTLDIVLRLKGRFAPARGGHVRVVDGEARAHERVHVVDLGPGKVGRAERVDDDPDAVHLHLVVAVLRAPVEPERVLETGTSAALHGDAQN